MPNRSAVALLVSLSVLACTDRGRDGPSPPPAVASVEVKIVPARIGVGESAQAAAVLRDAKGAALDDREITWRSSADGVASVDAAGKITGVAPGDASISALSEGVSGSATLTVSAPPVDRPPVITVASPGPEALARPVISVRATCADEGAAGCTQFHLWVNEEPVVSGASEIATDLDLTDFEGSGVLLELYAQDASDQWSYASRMVYVESSPRLDVVAGAPGSILDKRGSRLLFVDATSPPAHLRILDTGSGGVVDLDDNASSSDGSGWFHGSLTASGAIWAYEDFGGDVAPWCWARELRDGQRSELGGLDSCDSLRVAGDFALFSRWSEADASITLVRRDLATGTEVAVTTDAGNIDNDVAPNGDVVYWTNATDYNVYRWRDGVSTPLTADAVGVAWNFGPLTDGSAVVYRRSTPPSDADTLFRVVLDAGAGPAVLAPDRIALPWADPMPGVDYAIANGWVAYTRADDAGTPQVWRHGPEGDEQLTAFESWSTIDGLAPDGAVLLTHGTRRFLAAPGAPLDEIGSSLGRVVRRGDEWYVLVGGTVLRVAPGAAPATN